MSARLINLAALLFLAVAFPAAAQGTFSRSLEELGLSKGDYRLLREAAATLYEAEALEVGNTTTWSNRDTGSRGTVEVTAFDGRCVSLTHVFQSGTSRSAHKHDSRRCKAADGRWLLSAPK